MKKLYAVLVIVALALPAIVSASPYTSSVKDGTYEGTVSSIIPELNGQKATMKVSHEGDNVVATVTMKDSKEVWKWNDRTLNQQEFDVKTDKPVMSYGATAAKPVATNSQTFNVNCKDKAKNICDADSDSRFSWTINTNPSEIKYLVYGVSKDKKNDLTAKAEKRHEFTFKLAK